MIHPHGGRMIDRVVSEKEKNRIKSGFNEYPNYTISKEIAQEIDNIAHGIFSPLEGFLIHEDFLTVLDHGRLANDIPWTIPIVFDIERESLASLSEGDFVGLTIDRVALDGGNNPTADPVIVRIEVEYTSNRLGEAL